MTKQEVQGFRLKLARKLANLSPTQLCEKTGIDFTRYSLLEAGLVIFPKPLKKVLAEALKVDENYFEVPEDTELERAIKKDKSIQAFMLLVSKIRQQEWEESMEKEFANMPEAR